MTKTQSRWSPSRPSISTPSTTLALPITTSPSSRYRSSHHGPHHEPHHTNGNVVQLDTPLVYGDHVQPVCLPKTDDVALTYPGDLWVTGWGTTRGNFTPIVPAPQKDQRSKSDRTHQIAENGAISRELKQADVPIVDIETCEKEYPRKIVEDVRFVVCGPNLNLPCFRSSSALARRELTRARFVPLFFSRNSEWGAILVFAGRLRRTRRLQRHDRSLVPVRYRLVGQGMRRAGRGRYDSLLIIDLLVIISESQNNHWLQECTLVFPPTAIGSTRPRTELSSARMSCKQFYLDNNKCASPFDKTRKTFIRIEKAHKRGRWIEYMLMKGKKRFSFDRNMCRIVHKMWVDRFLEILNTTGNMGIL